MHALYVEDNAVYIYIYINTFIICMLCTVLYEINALTHIEFYRIQFQKKFFNDSESKSYQAQIDLTCKQM